MKQKTYRFRRLLAFLIDWNLAGLPALIGCFALMPLIDQGWIVLIMLPLMISFPVLFLHRDRLFKGRSPGNRLMKLVVLDRRTLQPLTGKALTTRNIFFPSGRPGCPAASGHRQHPGRPDGGCPGGTPG